MIKRKSFSHLVPRILVIDGSRENVANQIDHVGVQTRVERQAFRYLVPVTVEGTLGTFKVIDGSRENVANQIDHVVVRTRVERQAFRYLVPVTVGGTLGTFKRLADEIDRIWSWIGAEGGDVQSAGKIGIVVINILKFFTPAFFSAVSPAVLVVYAAARRGKNGL